MTLYRIFEGKDKKKCYVKNVRGKALSAIEITARNAVRPTSHFSEEEIKAFGLEDHEREVVTGISLVERRGKIQGCRRTALRGIRSVYEQASGLRKRRKRQSFRNRNRRKGII